MPNREPALWALFFPKFISLYRDRLLLVVVLDALSTEFVQTYLHVDGVFYHVSADRTEELLLQEVEGVLAH
jgi:hypothetical protein